MIVPMNKTAQLSLQAGALLGLLLTAGCVVEPAPGPVVAAPPPPVYYAPGYAYAYPPYRYYGGPGYYAGPNVGIGVHIR